MKVLAKVFICAFCVVVLTLLIRRVILHFSTPIGSEKCKLKIVEVNGADFELENRYGVLVLDHEKCSQKDKQLLESTVHGEIGDTVYASWDERERVFVNPSTGERRRGRGLIPVYIGIIIFAPLCVITGKDLFRREVSPWDS